jgi:hypothetical protein
VDPMYPELNSDADAAARSIVAAGDNVRMEDQALRVRFFYGALQDNTPETIEANRLTQKKQTYLEVPFISIQRRGEKDRVERPVWIDDYNSLADNHRWPKKWENFQKGIKEDEFEGGTRLVDTPFVNRALAAELAHEKIFTVEQLVAVPDVTIQKVTTGAMALKEKAKAFLALKKGSVPSSEELAATKVQLAEQKSQLDAMAAQLDTLKKQQQAGSNRPTGGK